MLLSRDLGSVGEIEHRGSKVPVDGCLAVF